MACATARAAQRAKPEARGRRRWEADGGPRRVEEKKNNDSNSKFKNLYFPGFKNCQKFTGARSNHQEHSATTKLKKLLRIAHRNSNKTAVFKASKNLWLGINIKKLRKKYLKFTI
jgi:hypothetical protein